MKSSTAPPSNLNAISAALSNTDSAVAVVDDFSSDCKPGRVVGNPTVSGYLRRGVDVERSLSIDNGALRIQPPTTPGWGRTGVAYGPFRRQAGLALAIFMVNGHNTSEGNSREDSYKSRIWRWVRGTEANSIGNRLWRRAISSKHRGTTRQFYRWARNRRGRFKEDGEESHLMENLALGWFSKAVPADPTAEGHSIVVRALGPENGELCVRCDRGPQSSTEPPALTPAFQGLQNLQTYYLVLLREQGAAYYAASVDSANGLVAFPNMRLIGIDAPDPHLAESSEDVYAGLYQSALGQVGWRVDTRVYDFQTQQLPALSNWYGTAQTADRLVAESATALTEQSAEVGGRWHSLQGTLERTERGLVARTENSLALLEMPAPAGAIHTVVNADDSLSACGLLWRTQDERNTWGLFFEKEQCQLRLQIEGKWSNIAVEEQFGLLKGRNTVQILDIGSSFSLYLNGQLLCDRWFTDSRLATASQLGLLYKNGYPDPDSGPAFSQLEAHPREIPIPAEFNLGSPWQTTGTKTLIADSFTGNKGELAERSVEVGSGQWQKTLGTGKMQLTGEGALKVDASVEHPNQGRLAYTVPWPNANFADVSVDILPPGTARGQDERGRGGLIFWQDADNYITINQWLDDGYGGAAISAFFHIDGFEEVYDAIWTNVGTRVQWGKQHSFRIAFDGLNFTVYINGEPVLYRALTDIYPKCDRLSIQRVGVVANWEWGDDTGTQFNRFVAKV